ncbi:winged helix-turn-helix domain-containing protein [Yersinia enterocolitica]|uniref:winged helix-turn-helix domain-containing protein n=1 Tax=Yersinia enterocolitica TaxID=630 RepID=UPI003F47E40C
METNEIVFKLEGTVLFSPAQRCLNGPNGLVVMLTENNLRFLELLLNGVTEKEQIINQVWKEQRGAVSESSYYGQLYMLRKAFIQVGLKESLIHTIPRKGVRYTGSVSQITVYKEPEKQQDNNDIQQMAILPAAPQIDIPSLPPESVVPQTLQPASKQNFLQSYRWKKLISLLAFFSFCWLSFLSALVIIILLGGDKPNP